MDELHHECGIAALYHLPGAASALAPLAGPEQVSRLMPRMLLDLQNRDGNAERRQPWTGASANIYLKLFQFHKTKN